MDSKRWIDGMNDPVQVGEGSSGDKNYLVSGSEELKRKEGCKRTDTAALFRPPRVLYAYIAESWMNDEIAISDSLHLSALRKACRRKSGNRR